MLSFVANGAHKGLRPKVAVKTPLACTLANTVAVRIAASASSAAPLSEPATFASLQVQAPGCKQGASAASGQFACQPAGRPVRSRSPLSRVRTLSKTDTSCRPTDERTDWWTGGCGLMRRLARLSRPSDRKRRTDESDTDWPVSCMHDEKWWASMGEDRTVEAAE